VTTTPACLTVGAAWCTYFRWRNLKVYPGLRWSYRAPGLFLAGMGSQVRTTAVLGVDEHLDAADFDGARASRGEDVDILYVATHGEYHSPDFRAILHATQWEPFASGLGQVRPTVAIFDACWLVDPAGWLTAMANGIGPALRLVLGYATPASMGKGPALRGHAFADNLAAGDGVADAWLKAVHDQRVPKDRAVAIGFGDSDLEATRALDATLADLPLPAQQPLRLRWRYCH